MIRRLDDLRSPFADDDPVVFVLALERQLARALAPRDLTWVLDPEPRAGYGDPLAFKAPLEN